MIRLLLAAPTSLLPLTPRAKGWPRIPRAVRQERTAERPVRCRCSMTVYAGTGVAARLARSCHRQRNGGATLEAAGDAEHGAGSVAGLRAEQPGDRGSDLRRLAGAAERD